MIEPAPGAADTVFSRLWACSVCLRNYLVWFSYQIGQKESAMDCQDCWEDYWCSTAHPPRAVHLHSEEIAHTQATERWALEHPGTSFPPQASWTIKYSLWWKPSFYCCLYIYVVFFIRRIMCKFMSTPLLSISSLKWQCSKVSKTQFEIIIVLYINVFWHLIAC